MNTSQQNKENKEPLDNMIYATATPPGTSALAIIRISGNNSVALIEKLMMLEKNRLSGMRRKVGQIYDAGKAVDNIVALTWTPEKSYTGEEMVELICHGIPEVIREIEELLEDNGVVAAEPGEFTRRAYFAGKMSQMDVFALSLMFDGSTSEAEKAGLLMREFSRMLKELRNFREELEGNIEFAEAHPSSGGSDPAKRIEELAEKAEELLVLTRGIEGKSRIWIMGARNTGKSTLFNLLAGSGNALVSEVPGTTRDGFAAEIEIDGRKLLVNDTAGVDGTGLDREAVEMVIKGLNEYDRIIWLSEGGMEEAPGELRDKVADVLEISSKSDICKALNENKLKVSSVTEEGIAELRKWLSDMGRDATSRIAAAFRNSIREAQDCITAGDYALGGSILLHAENHLKMILDEKSLNLSVERALSKLCVGK